MVLLKKLTIAVFVSVAMLAAAPSAIAKPKGKIENATPEATVIAIDESIELAAEVLKAIEADELSKEDMLALFKKTKQKAKTIESTTTYMLREKALSKLGKARSAYKKGKDKTYVSSLMEKSFEVFKAIKVRYNEFN